MERHIKKKISNDITHIFVMDEAFSENILEDLRARYKAIGGISPLAEMTEKQAKALAIV